jgi:hypothetical protein
MSAVPLAFDPAPPPLLLVELLPLLLQAAPVVACPSITYRAYRERSRSGPPAADMIRDVVNAGMNSVANVNMCLKIVGVTSLSQLCPRKKKEVMSVRLLQFAFTAKT